MIGLQNAGKTSLLRVLAVSPGAFSRYTSFQTDRVAQGGEFTIEYVPPSEIWPDPRPCTPVAVLMFGP